MKYLVMIGTKLSNRYEILREIGRGGMGVVYLARDPLLERDVAVKLITPALLSSEAEERFKREARVVAQMDHPAIVAVYDVGEQEGSLFFVMPLIRGTNLRSLLNEKSLNLGDVMEIGIQVAEALEYSHARGIVHRDIKPENILVMRQESGGPEIRVKVTDFGLAMASAQSRLTQTGALVGTVSYLSPEQMSEKEIDHRSDVYSLGTLLYECIAGEPPFSGEVQSVLYRVVHELPQPLRSLADVHEELEGIIMHCLEKDRAKRPQHARELAEALIRYRSRLQENERTQMLSPIQRTSAQFQRPLIFPLVGREKEFAELQRRLNAALQGECQFVVVAGEAGVGKRRLLDELENLAKARRIPVLHGRFVEQDQSFPYQGFCDAIQEFFRSRAATESPLNISDLAPELVSLFPMLKEIEPIRSALSGTISSTPTAEQRKVEDKTSVFELLAGTFIRISSGKPLVLLLEDLHSAEVSIEALQYIVRRLGPTPTLMIGTYRTTEVVKRHPILRMLDSFQDDRRFILIRLEPFLPSEYRAFLEAILGSPDLDHSFADKLYEATEGNPYFTRELVRSLMDSKRIVKADTGYWILSGEAAISSEALPATIQQTVQKRIERLPKNLKDLLSLASVLGKTFEFRDLTMLSGKKKNLEDAVERLVQAGFLEEDRESRGDRFLFSSGVLRDVLYSAISRSKRKSLHKKCAEELEKRNSGRLERVYPQLLHHYAQGNVADKAVEYGLRLARKSLDAFGTEDARRAVRIVLDFLEDLENRSIEGEARTLMAEAYRREGNIDQALQELEMAAKVFERVNEASRVVETIVTAAETAWETRKVEETRRWVEKGLDAARALGNPTNLIRILSLGATLANLRGEYEKAKEYLEEAEKLQPKTTELEEIPIGGKLVVALPVAIQATHPVDSRLDEELEVFANIHETLVTTDAQGGLVPCLCDRWEAFEQGRSFVFTLRQDVRMHDDRILTAKDVKKSFEKAIKLSSDDMPAAYAAIRGVSEYLKGLTEHITGIVALSEHTLQVDLLEALTLYPALLTDPRTGIVRESAGGSVESAPVGTGPFLVKALNPDCVILARNSNYWKGFSPLLDEIKFEAGLTAAEIASGFRSGDFDLARDLLPEDLEEILRERHLRINLVEAPKKNTYFVLFNKFSPVAWNPALRLALCGAVRTHDLVRGTLGRSAQPAEGLLPPGILGHDPGRRRYPLPCEKVSELLESSRLSLPLRMKACVHPILQDRYASLTKALFKVWSDIGVEISIETPTMKSFLEYFRKSEGVDMILSRWIADYDDPDNFTYGLFYSKAGDLRSYYSSEEADRLIEEARTESRPAARERLYRKFENILIETGTLLPLFHEIDYRVANQKVKRLTLRSNPPYVNYAEIGKAEAPALERKGEGGIIRVPVAGEIHSLDPSLASLTVQAEVLPTIFETLTRETEAARIVPWLVSEFHAEEGGRRFRFRLREDIRFHDGRRPTARDVRYSFEHLLQNRESESRWLLSPIRGAETLLNTGSGDLEGFRIHSSFEFSIDLDRPISFFPAVLAYLPSSILPEGTSQFTGSWRDGCIGTGPFRVTRFDPGRRLELEANPYYWRPGYPKSDRLFFTFGVSPPDLLSGFRAGRFSLAWELFPSDVEALRHESEFGSKYQETPRLSTYYVVFNSHKGPLSDEKLRHRLIEGIDTNSLVRQNVGRLANPAHSLIPPGLLGYEAAPQTAPASLPGGQSSKDIELTGMALSIYEGPYSCLANKLLTAFREKGFKIRMVNETKNDRDKYLESPNVDFFLARWIADYPDADTFIYGVLHSEKGIVGRVCGTPEIDSLIEKARTETRSEIRHEIYREAERIIARDTLLLPLFHEQAYRFARPEVDGFEVTFALPHVAYEKLWIRR